MAAPSDRSVEVFRLHPAALWVSVFVALLLQAFLPVKIPLAHLLDLPLLVTIYFALVRRNKVFGIFLGAALGLLQDALAHGYIGMFGMAKAIVGYLAASASVHFDIEPLLTRSFMTGTFVVIHSFTLLALEHVLLEFAPPFQALDIGSSILVNIAVGLILFQVLDRFKQAA
jgi:rod shape-determining protein MreD